MNPLDQVISWVSPEKALNRIRARQRLNFYEAGKKTHERPWRTDRGSGDQVVMKAGDSLRVQARHLEQNHDLAKGILDTLVNNIVGQGIRYEPQVMNKSGELHAEFNERLTQWHERWAEFPEVTRCLSLSELERLFCRTWLRDGEAFKIYHSGNIRSLNHPTPVFLSIDALEPDYCPMQLNDESKKIVQGIQKNGWGQAKTFYFYKNHPGDNFNITGLGTDLKIYKQVKASDVSHLKMITRLRQTRGVSVFAVVMNRLDDLKDFEESERIAARIATKMVAYIKKGIPDLYDPEADTERQTYEKGMTFYDLNPGEEIGTIDTNRPNSGLEAFRSGQLKAAAAGAGTGYSSIARDYNGSFAAQRQENVEQQVNYAVLQDMFIKGSCKPDYKRFVQMALAGGIDVPGDVDIETIFDVDCSGTPCPWVDPLKDLKADALSVDYGFSSRSQVIRKRGGNPAAVMKQIERDKNEAEKRGLVFATQADLTEPPETQPPENE